MLQQHKLIKQINIVIDTQHVAIQVARFFRVMDTVKWVSTVHRKITNLRKHAPSLIAGIPMRHSVSSDADATLSIASGLNELYKQVYNCTLLWAAQVGTFTWAALL